MTSLEIIQRRNRETERVNNARRIKTDPSGFTVRIRKDIVSRLEIIQAYQLSKGSKVTPLSKTINQILEEYCFDNSRLIDRLEEAMKEDANQ